MVERLLMGGARRGPAHLPQRCWALRAPRAYLWGGAGAFVGAAALFAGWWVWGLPLWLMAPAVVLGWFVPLPAAPMLALDDRGVALIVPSWNRDQFLWIPHDRLVRVELRQGWLVATGTVVEQQGDLNWTEAAKQAGTMIPPWLQLHFSSGLGANQIAAPIHLLDQLGRDEIELWLYRQGK